ncbi:MAG: hypothetical protein PHN51_04910 [Candidatus Nanopelagicales bacterium]|nr:hypothetical protein [Candidatus Nanopelagicales bacterium]
MNRPFDDDQARRRRRALSGIDGAVAKALGQTDFVKSLGITDWAKRYPDLFATTSTIAKIAGLQSQFAGPESPFAKLAAAQAGLAGSTNALAKIAEQAAALGANNAIAKLVEQSKLTGAESAISKIAEQYKGLSGVSEIAKANQAALNAAGMSSAMEAALASTRAMPEIRALSGYEFTLQYADLLKNATAFTSAFEQHRARILELTKHIGKVGLSFLPPNWQEVGFPDNLEELLLDEGLPLAWVPPQEILQKLFAAKTAGQRRQIISANRKRITEACITELEAIRFRDKARQVWVDDFALEAAYALRDGRWRASQALSANLLDSVLSNAIEKSAHDEVKNNRKKIAWETYPVKPALVLGALYGIHAQYFPSKGDPIPTRFSRHASVHGVSIQQYKQVNAVIALMHVVGLLRLVEDESHPVKGRKKRTK